MPDDEIVAELTAVRGLGVWTAHMFLIFHLERPDVLPVGDLGVRNAIATAYGLDEPPTPEEMERIAAPWRPHRTLRESVSVGVVLQRARLTQRLRPIPRLASRGNGAPHHFRRGLALGELTSHEDILALVERAWEARQERFGDSTDLCSLVNAKSGGCAEDCGFCAQSRYAEADTPMHAMMEPDQILEHAKAAEAAGAHRFCMVTQGQGLSKRDFERIVEGAKLVSEQTNLKRCVSIGHISPTRAKTLKEAGVQRVHHNVESSKSYYPEVSTTVRYEGRIRTIDAIEEAGLESCVGGILNLGESKRQRVEMAFELSELDPTSVPINLLNPRDGTKFGDRELMDPWEVVQWVAIFRLIIPGALFRLCGGRVENLGDLQPLAVKAGLERRDDGELPDHARLGAGRRSRDVRGAGPERRPPGRQRREPPARQPRRLARRLDARHRDR